MNNEPKETGRLEGDAARRQARIVRLEKRNQQLEEALRFYADEKNYIDGKYFVAGKVPVDQGKCARAALSSSKEAEGE